MIRRAETSDRTVIESIVREAYSVYIDRIGKPPGPMLDDYGSLIGQGRVSVLVDGNSMIVALVVLLPTPDYLLLDNIAVRPDRQGRGFGQQLIAFAESEARRLGYAELRLYTHEQMTENIVLYARLGFRETGRGHQDGYDRVFMAKRFDGR